MEWYKNIQDSIIPKKEDFDNPLYRIVSFDTLLKMFNEKKNTLVLTSKWEDVYENFLLKESFIRNGKPYSLDSFQDRVFGQCWSTKQSSDALWRIYSPDKKSVRIKTTIGRLWNCKPSKSCGGSFLIGKVQYFSQSKIQEDLVKVSSFSVDELSKLMISSLFVKRTSFSHESEYRLIYMCDEDSPDNGQVVKELDIDPHDFIKSVYFDPRCDLSYFERCKRVLMKAFGYPASKIKRSNLYAFDPCTLEIRD